MSADADALAMIDKFEQATSGQGTWSVWKAIRKEEVVSGLRERINDKDGLNQHTTDWCTIAALVHSLLYNDPASYVQLAIDLYTRGQGSWRGKLIGPNDDLIFNPPPDGLVVNGTTLTFNRADWIVMSSIRHTIHPADHISRTNPQGTFLHEIEKFVRGMGYTKIESDYSENTLSKDQDNALRANKLLKEGYRVLLNINACMLFSDKQADWGGEILWHTVPKPNHTVQLTEKIELYASDTYSHLDCRKIDQDDNVLCSPHYLGGLWVPEYGAVRFAVYTWSEGHYKVPHDPKKPLKLKDFLWNYYGYLAFKG
jgi:hypothetical protein